MITIAGVCLLLVAGTAASVCSTEHYKRYGDECTCSDVCLDNTHCQLNQTGGYSCQCLPCLVYDPVLRQCITVKPSPPTTAPPVTTAAPPTTTRGPDCSKHAIADIYFLADSSNSIYPVGWGRELAFVTNTTKAFKLGPDDVQVAFGIFSTQFQHIIDLNKYTDHADFAADVLDTPQLKELTYTYDALDAINREGYLTSPVHGARAGVPKVLIVITDGQSPDIARTVAAADALKKQGITILAIGVGVNNLDELQGIASRPEAVFSVQNFGALDSIRDQITQTVCDGSTETTTAAPEPTTPAPEPTTPAPEPTTPAPVQTTPEESCEDFVRADIYFLADSSNSIYPVGWGRELAFITNTTKAFKLGPDDVQVAFGIFSTRFQHIIDLNKYTDHADFAADVLSTPQLKELTYTYDALNAINRQGYLTSTTHGSRTGVAKVLVVITDGQSQNITRTLQEAEALRQQNITILAVGVGVTNQVELQGIAGTPDSVFGVKNFAALDSITGLITQRICQAPIHPEDCPCFTLTPQPRQGLWKRGCCRDMSPAPVPGHCPRGDCADPPCAYPGELDLAILVDASSSIGHEIFDRNFEFVGSIARGFTLDEARTKVALVTFSTSPQPVFRLTANTDTIYQSLLNVPFVNGSSNADLALQSAQDLLSPAYGGRAGARKAVVLITNRVSSDPAAAFKVANQLKSQGVNIFTLGIQPTADSLELTGLASRVPYNFPVPNYETLVKYASTVAQVICEAPPPPKPVDPCPPQPVDLFVAVDSSGSIVMDEYKYNFELISRILSAFTISENSTKVSLLTYGTSVKPRFPLSPDKDYIDQQLKNVPYQGSTTNTHLALLYILNGGYNDPANGARPTARKVIVLITDGKSTMPDETLKAAEAVKSQGFVIAVIGVGNKVDQSELDAVASQKDFVLLPNNYAELENFASEISKIVCNNKI